ncbi:MAG: DUF1800 family protein [Pseudomonadota bacterium]
MAGTGTIRRRVTTTLAGLTLSSVLCACGGGGGGGESAEALNPISEGPTTPPTSPAPAPAPTPDPGAPTGEPGNASFFESASSTSRFLSTATFGARMDDIDRLAGSDASVWFLNQLSLPASTVKPIADGYYARLQQDSFLPFSPNTMAFWLIAVDGPDQLRWRMAFALSQIMVASDFGGEFLSDFPAAIGYYLDVLATHSLGNYRELLEAVTYTPAMAHYLTYLGNLPADDATGRMPDENYAREILQLFSIGLLELNSDGSVRTGTDGQPIETYSNSDITGLARVFTGLDFTEPAGFSDEEGSISDVLGLPLTMYEDLHSTREKRFLGASIPAGTSGSESIRRALDHIMAHPNVAPFVGRQLIQRFTTSNPSAAYISEVALAFESGRYVLPDNSAVGDGRKGDLAATIAAVLFSNHAQQAIVLDSLDFGKPREPVLRFTQWARAFNVDASAPEYMLALYDTLDNGALAQHPFRSRSVFNFYRPGYVAPGTESGTQGMTVPELQIVNASSIPGYMNFMTFFIFGGPTEDFEVEEVQAVFEEDGALAFDREAALRSFAPNYERELALASDTAALVQRLDLLLAHGDLSPATEAAIAEVITNIPMDDNEDFDGAFLRVGLAILMTMTAPEYLVQR